MTAADGWRLRDGNRERFVKSLSHAGLKPVLIAALSVALLLLTSIPAHAGPALWHLSDDDSDIYIFGTVHILPPDLDWRYPELDAAFAAADTVYFEVPTDPEDAAATQALVFELGLNAPGERLSESLSLKSLDALSEIAPRVGLGAAQIDPMRPWLASLTISLSYFVAQGQDPQAGVENVLSREARAAGKSLAYLETIEQQFRFFADMDEAVQLEMLEQTIFDIHTGEVDILIEEMDGYWVSGDVEGLDQLINETMQAEAPEVYETLIVRRNLRWVEQIEDILSGSGTVFLAVGAGHLAGKDSVVTLLRARGHAISGP